MVRFSCPTCKAVVEHPTAGDKLACPNCGQRVQVPYPRAKTVLGDWPPAPPSQAPAAGPAKGEGEKFCHECGAVIKARAAVCPRCGVEQPPPSYPARAKRLAPGVRPHRGILIMVLGGVALFTVPFVLGPIAWTLGNEDLKLMRQGRMDPEGEGLTAAGRVCGMIASILGLAGLGMACLWFTLYMSCLGGLIFGPLR